MSPPDPGGAKRTTGRFLTPQSSGSGFLLVLGCFIASGGSALLYETAWSSLLGAVFGTSQLAVAAVLVATMGGLAIGASLAGRWGRSIERPLVVYALLELAIGAAALAVFPLISVARRLQTAMLGVESFDQLPSVFTTAGFYLCSSVLILILPTALMGATLPVLAGGVVRGERALGRRIGALYAANTIGAAAGALASAFVLLPAFGLKGTIWVGVVINVVVAVAAIVLATRGGSLPPIREPVTATGAGWVLPVIAASGGVAFVLEVMWTRLLGQILGSSVRGFALLLAVFLCGLALGAGVAARRTADAEAAAKNLFRALVGVAVTSLSTFVLAPWLLPRQALPTFVEGLGFAAAVLLPSAICLGAAFPCAVRLRAARVNETVSAAGQVTVWNTVGTIFGALLTAVVLLPTIKFVGTVKVAAAGAGLLAGTTALVGQRQPRKGYLTCFLAVFVLAVPIAPPWAILQRSVLGLGSLEQPVFYEVGRAATVILREEAGGWRLTTDGLPESSIRQRGSWAGAIAGPRWLSMLPMALRPETRAMLVIGLGGAQTLQEIPAMVERIDVVEIESRVVEVNRLAGEWRRSDPLKDGRVRVFVQDARSALTLSESRYDAIVSQPSHPWTAGSSHLFTRDFFELVSRRLSPRGVLVQWLATPFADTDLLRTTVATLLDVFDHVALYSSGGGGSLFFVASMHPVDSPELYDSAAEWSNLGVISRDDLIAARILDTEGARRYSKGASLTTDDRNAFADRGVEILRARHRASLQQLLAEQQLPATVELVDLGRRMIEQRNLEGASHVAGGIDDAVHQESLRGLIAQARGRLERARQGCWRALQWSRTDEYALLCLFRTFRSEIGSGSVPARVRLALEADRQTRLLLDAHRSMALGDWQSVRDFEPELAEVSTADLFYRESIELRATWRAASGEPRQVEEAIELLEKLLDLGGAGEFVLRRAELIWQLGDRDRAVGAFQAASPRIRGNPALWNRARHLAQELQIDLNR